jgi:S1-C subfamily serine protease
MVQMRGLFGFPILLLILASPLQAAQASLAEIVAKDKPAVVFIVVATGAGAQSGTGFVIHSDSHSSTIVTANHVIEGGTQIDVIFDSNEGERYQAKVVRADHRQDVAVLQVSSGKRRALELDNASQIEEGMSIAVIGYPLATLEFKRIAGDALRPSVHGGIVSAVRFQGRVIQFDAATYHGDSGGPIIDAANGHVIAIVHGAPLDPSFAAHGLEEALPGSSFGPSSTAIGDVLAGDDAHVADAAPQSYTASAGTASEHAVGGGGSDSASYRVGYGVPHLEATHGDSAMVSEVNSTVESSALDRLTTFLKADNSLYLIPVQLSPQVVSNSQVLSGYCDDNRLNALVVPWDAWNLTGGPRYNAYGTIMGYSGTASVTADLFVFDCFGIPFFAEQKTKSENRYFVHRTPDREIVDMTNDLLDQLMRDFGQAESQRAGAWKSLLKTGIAIDPNDGAYHSLFYFQEKPVGYQVMAVAPNGPAARAGIAVQDVILKVNGVDISTLSAAELMQQMNKPEYTVEVQRPSGTIDITVHPELYSTIVQALQH